MFSVIRRMQSRYLWFTFCALWIQALVPAQLTEGLSCFSCNSKTQEGCKNEHLKSGHRNNLFSEKCLGKDAVCLKMSVEVDHYYEEHYSQADLKRYYEAMDIAAECNGKGVKPGTSVTVAPHGSNETATGSGADHPDGTAAPAGEGGGEAAEAASTAEPPPAEPAPAEGDAPAPDAGRRRRAVATNCPAYPKQFPEPQAVVEKSDRRWVYSCGNRSQWLNVKMNHCHTHSDGILARSVCMCNQDLCNGAVNMQAAVPFVVLAAALLHLQRVVD